MTPRLWASGAKLTRQVVDKLRAQAPQGAARDAYIEHHAQLFHVHVLTIKRAIDRKTWVHAKGKALSATETRKCPVCGQFFGRNWNNGRRRSDRFWQQKRTCGSSCAVKLAWQEGRFDNRATPNALSRQGLWQRIKAWFGF